MTSIRFRDCLLWNSIPYAKEQQNRQFLLQKSQNMGWGNDGFAVVKVMYTSCFLLADSSKEYELLLVTIPTVNKNFINTIVIRHTFDLL